MDLAATSQAVFEEIFLGHVTAQLAKYPKDRFDGIIVTGGCALNVKVR